MSVIREFVAASTYRCKHCLKKLTQKEIWFFHGYCTECWRLRGKD